MLREAAADEELAPGRLEQAARLVGRVGRRRRAAGCAGGLRRGGAGGWRGPCASAAPGRGEAEQGDRRDGESAHTRSAYRMKNWPDGWFEP